MKFMQRRIVGELLRVFLLLTIGMTGMLVFVGVFQQAQGRLSPGKLLEIMPYIVPTMLPFTIPATLLLAITVVYGRMAGDLEVIAFKAAGVSPMKLLTPAFALGGILAVLSYGLTNFATPWAMDNMERIVYQALGDIFLEVIDSQHYYTDPDQGYSITVEDVQDRDLINPTFCVRQSDHRQLKVSADRARISFDLEAEKILIYLLNPRGSVPGRDSDFMMGEREFALPLRNEKAKPKPRYMTIANICDEIDSFKSRIEESQLRRDQESAMLMLTGDFVQFGEGSIQPFADFPRTAEKRIRRLHTETHSRYSMAGSCLFFALLGGPFAVYQARRQFITSFIMCFLPILLVYYPVMFLMVNLGKKGDVDPSWAMWTPNVLIGIVAIIVLRRVVKH